MSDDLEERTLGEWVLRFLNLNRDHKREVLEDYRQGWFHNTDEDWEITRLRAVNIVMPGFEMAENLGKELDR